MQDFKTAISAYKADPSPETACTWAISKGAPQRGSFEPITSRTRCLVKFWLSAHGVGLDVYAPLTVQELADIWHDTTNAALNSIKQKGA